MGINTLGDIIMSGSGSLKLPSGTTAQRPGSPSAGMFRFNSTIGEPEWYDGTAATWQTVKSPNFSVQYLLVAGGGGGGYRHGAGGGAGGYISGIDTLSINNTYSITVGAGGAGGNPNVGGNGADTIFRSSTAVGGGGGSSFDGGNGGNGGSGGGGAESKTNGYGIYPGSSYISATRQGYDGGPCTSSAAYNHGGGGGAGAVGGTGTQDACGNGGAGIQNTITGSTIGQNSGGNYYIGGGGGGGSHNPPGTASTGGLGGGGAGGTPNLNNPGVAGTANTGGGGGGASTTSGGTSAGGAGGSGVVIISVPNSYIGTFSNGLTVTTITSGLNKIYQITAGTGTVSFT